MAINTREVGYAHRSAITGAVSTVAASVGRGATKVGGIVGGYVAGFVVGMPANKAIKAQKLIAAKRAR